jgi:hypothetical protein
MLQKVSWWRIILGPEPKPLTRLLKIIPFCYPGLFFSEYIDFKSGGHVNGALDK